MKSDFTSLLGPKERFRPATSDSWHEIEKWVDRELPADYKELVDGYGDGVLLGHLFLPHPQGNDQLLTFMREEREFFHQSFAEHRHSLKELDSQWGNLVPWAYHDWNGDVCLLVPPDGDGEWAVALAYRQCPRIEVLEGGVTEFITTILGEGRLPNGWPGDRPRWQSIDGSPLI
ncbi:hypothetical protein [Streptomyces californicus]|uniref:hypothetical protein n=1 Tax=Streptomyces californicus TaxID=67351 RepID=UPI0036AF697C